MCLCFCFSTLSLSSFAVEFDPYTGLEFDFDTDMYYDPYTGLEMFYDEDNDVYYSPHKPFEFEPISTYRVSSPNFTDFDISKLPWLEMPSYVQEIIRAQRIPSGKVDIGEYQGEFKYPFVCVVRGGSYVAVYAGYNLCIGAYFASSTDRQNLTPNNYTLISVKKHTRLYANAVCYTAVYNASDFSIRDPWTSIEPVAHGDNFVRYKTLNFVDSNIDTYFYGSNGLYPDRVLESTYLVNNETYPQYVMVNNIQSGFASGTIIYAPDNWVGYIGSFTPPSAEALQQSTSKSILETLKQIPTNMANAIKGFFTSLGDRISGFFDSLATRINGIINILAEKIKGFFLPSEGYFDEYVADFQEYFKDRFGLLYELPDAVIGILQQFIEYFPNDSGYYIDFPDVVMPVFDNGEWSEVQIIDATSISFEFLEQGAFKTLYSMYRSVVWMIFIFALINLIIRKSERVFGGSG